MCRSLFVLLFCEAGLDIGLMVKWWIGDGNVAELLMGYQLSLTWAFFIFFFNLFSCNISQGGKYVADVAASVDREASL